MAKGRGNIANIILIQSLCMLLFHSLMIQADIYNVGDEKGWTFGVQNWPSGKTFKEGDILGKYHNFIKFNSLPLNTHAYKPLIVRLT
jgi:hypothetical protein